jgi:hypothetical protein
LIVFPDEFETDRNDDVQNAGYRGALWPRIDIPGACPDRKIIEAIAVVFKDMRTKLGIKMKP